MRYDNIIGLIISSKLSKLQKLITKKWIFLLLVVKLQLKYDESDLIDCLTKFFQQCKYFLRSKLLSLIFDFSFYDQ